VDVTRRLAEFSVETRYRDLPAEVVEKGKERILDTLGCMIAGCTEALASLMLKYVEETGGRPEATIVGFGHKTDVAKAALVNGTLGHALDFDDTQISFSGHPSTVILPATLSLGEKMNCSGEAILEAFLVGFEVACKIGRGVNPRLYENGWHATSVIGTLGAAVAAGKVLGLDADEMTSALGLAASQSCGLKENFGTMTKPLHAGKAVESGVISALFAKDGFTASQQILEAKRGFCAVFSSGQFDLNPILENLGNPYDIISPGVHTKPYPSCLMTHQIIDAMLSLAESHNIQPEEVDSVVCEIAPLASGALIHSNPETGLQGKFSAPYVVAVSLLEPRVSLEQFTDQKVRDPKARAMMQKVKVTVHPELEGEPPPVIVHIRLKDGKEYTQRVDIATGSPEKPLSLDRMIEKFRSCADAMINRKRIDEAIDMILRLEKLTDVTKLIALIVQSKSIDRKEVSNE
jgi:2-methylcitrate dehydratase PrpD